MPTAEEESDNWDDNEDSSEPGGNSVHDPLDGENSPVDNEELGFSAVPDFVDGDHEAFDPLGDFETEMQKAHGSVTAPPIKTWESEMPLILFRETAIKIADDYLRQKDIKLRKGRKKAPAKDHAVYKLGKKDSHKMDVRGKRLEAA